VEWVQEIPAAKSLELRSYVYWEVKINFYSFHYGITVLATRAFASVSFLLAPNRWHDVQPLGSWISLLRDYSVEKAMKWRAYLGSRKPPKIKFLHV
jgi:hypothetical protein